MGQNVFNYYGFMNKGMYDHFILSQSRYDNDLSSVKSEDSEETITMDPSVANIKPRKTKFAPQSYHSCPYCGKWYRSKTSLGLHRRLECGKEPAFQCPFCPLKTHQKGNLQVHIKKKHTFESHDGSQSLLKSRNPILAHELGMMPKLNAQKLGINREISSELTITRTQSKAPLTYTRTPNLSHILSQPNKAHGVTQFPLTVTEINVARPQNDRSKIRVKGLANIPSGIEITQKTIPERRSSDVTCTPAILETTTSLQELVKNNKHREMLNVNNSEGASKHTEAKKLPELTRILNSQEPIPLVPIPVVPFSVDPLAIPDSSATAVKDEPLIVTKESTDLETPDSTDKEPI